MIYRAIGLMSGSSLDGLDIAFVEFVEAAGKWTYEIKAATCATYNSDWQAKLGNASRLTALEYLRLHTAYGYYVGGLVNDFIAANQLQHQVQLVASHGHTVFHEPHSGTTAQLGDGAAIAAVTGIHVVSDLRAMDVALGGQGAPIVPMGEKILFTGYPLLLNLGGIANISASLPGGYVAFDICPANKVLNMLANEIGLPYDEAGSLAAKGFVRDEPLAKMNREPYYITKFPKSLANSFGTDVIYAMLKNANLSVPDALRTMVEHITIQTTRSVGRLVNQLSGESPLQMLVTGGGAFNTFLMERLQTALKIMGVELVVPDETVVQYKESLIMALLGVLRWREENTVLHTVTGASRGSIGGAVWMGSN